MTKAADTIQKALAEGRRCLGEYDAKQFLGLFGVPVSKDILAADGDAAAAAADRLGYPVVLKAVGDRLTHKTEVGGVALNVRTAAEVIAEAARLTRIPGCETLMVSPMAKGARELVCGLARDPHFGPAVMFGLGGVLTEVLNDTVFRIAPLTEADAEAMLSGIRAKRILDPFRGEAAADRKALANILMAMGRIGMEHEEVAEIDVNPLKIGPDGLPVAVDALIVLK
ncbi:MAG: acetate--CoA ligase family protein [Pseudomonadota bacterium]|nr:acetate--CoA ligase family protein [Pseudomonadota bacterium]